MSKYTLTAVDTTGIQQYIFGSNRLQENIGASELVWRATGEWALEAVRAVAPQANNVLDAKMMTLKPDAEFQLERQTAPQAAEVLYAGGGNIVVLFSQHELACEFAYQLTRRALQDAPGLALVVAHRQEFDFAHDTLSSAVQNLLGQRLAAQKAGRLPSAPLLGMGVTAVCDSTGLPAAHTNHSLRLGKGEQLVPLSSEVVAKRRNREAATERLNSLLTEEQKRAFEFREQLDDLGRELGQESYVAVVHADGNGVGGSFRQLARQFASPSLNRDYIEAMRGFSRKLNEASKRALQDVIGLLTLHPSQAGKTTLPFRPLVFGGDDVTFVCRGNLGVSLAAAYLEAFERQTASVFADAQQKFYASAGVAIVKMHYPFARAYHLSEALAQSAKSYLRETQREASALDWHFAASGLSGSLQDIRAREYQTDDGALLLRPLLLKAEEHDQDGRAWRERVEKLVLTFQDDRLQNKGTPQWSGRRNKLKALREALRVGPAAIADFRRNYLDNDKLPGFMPGEPYQDNGWFKGRCGYFDALELFDHYVPLIEWEGNANDE